MVSSPVKLNSPQSGSLKRFLELRTRPRPTARFKASTSTRQKAARRENLAGWCPGSRDRTLRGPELLTRDPELPNGCHVCEVEIDPETGATRVLRYVVVDDVGTVINPLTLAGQIHGGVAQGIGQAFTEQFLYDERSG
jgi:CO/xanthine dehydrogenase Mo-binding subunit